MEEKCRIVEQTLKPGASVARVALAHGVNANQVFSWRRQYLQGLLNQVIEINDVLNKRNLWRHEYPTIGAGSKTREEVIADASQWIREQRRGDN